MEHLYIRFNAIAFIRKRNIKELFPDWKNEVPVAFLQGIRYSLHPISRPLPGYTLNVLPGLFSSENSQFLQTRTNPHIRHVNIPGSAFTRVEN